MGIAPLYKRPIRRTITLGDYSPGGRRISAAVVVSGVTLDAPQADGLSHMDKPATGSQPCAVPLLDDAVDHVLPEHPGWRMSSSRMVRVVDCPDGSRWLLEAQAKTVTATRLHGSGPPPPVDVFTLDGIPAHRPDQAALFSRLKQLGVVARVRTCSVWEAVATAIVRQVIRVELAKRLCRRFCDTFGEHVTLPDGSVYTLFPSPERILRLRDADFRAAGMRFKRPVLVAAARAYLTKHDIWQAGDPARLIEVLQTVPRVGPWTARAAVADFTNDWSLYPYEDLAVRTWAARVAPSISWPTCDREFRAVWRAVAGPHLSPVTLLTLAWGAIHGTYR